MAFINDIQLHSLGGDMHSAVTGYCPWHR